MDRQGKSDFFPFLLLKDIKKLLQQIGTASFIAGHPAGEEPRDFYVTEEAKEARKGKVVDSPGLLGELFKRAWKVYIDIESKPIESNFVGEHLFPSLSYSLLDLDLLRPGRLAFKSDAMTQHRHYNSRARAIMEEASGDASKATLMEALRV